MKSRAYFQVAWGSISLVCIFILAENSIHHLMSVHNLALHRHLFRGLLSPYLQRLGREMVPSWSVLIYNGAIIGKLCWSRSCVEDCFRDRSFSWPCNLNRKTLDFKLAVLLYHTSTVEGTVHGLGWLPWSMVLIRRSISQYFCKAPPHSPLLSVSREAGVSFKLPAHHTMCFSKGLTEKGSVSQTRDLTCQM